MERDPSADTTVREATLVHELSVGAAAETPPEYQFSHINSLVVMPDGVFWVADGRAGGAGASPLVRQFDAEGRFVRQVGRTGSGPGEYRAPNGMALLRDGGVALRDYELPDRITVYGDDGSLEETWALPGPYRWVYFGGSPLDVDTAGIIWMRFQNARPGPDRPPPELLRLSPNGTVLDTVPVPTPPDVPALPSIRIVRTLPSGGTSTLGLGVPYQPAGIWRWTPFGGFAIARTDEYRVELHAGPAVPGTDSSAVERPVAARDAAAPVVVSRAASPVPISDAERAALRQALTERVRAQEGGENVAIPEMPTHKPLLRSIRFGDDGRMWVGVSTPSRKVEGEWQEASAFDVFDTEGGYLGRVTMPEGFEAVRMRGDRMWGVYRGEMDIESIRRYRIVWP